MSKKRRKSKDPFAAREAQKYDNPIPSREYILEYLEQEGKPVGFTKLQGVLDLHSEQDVEALQRRLRAMERDGQLIKNRRGQYGLVDKMNLISGRVIGHRDGFGFLVPDDGMGEDLFLNAREMRSLFDGDKALVRVSKVDQRGRREGQVVEVLEHNTTQLVGRLHYSDDIVFVEPDSKRIPHDIIIPHQDLNGAEDEQIVVVAITDYPSKRRHARGRIIEVLGEHMAPGMEIEVALRAHNIPSNWPAPVQKAISKVTAVVSEQDKESRTDIRDLPLVTIDGDDAKDFDDAVYCEPGQNGAWRLWVAIADVSHYVKIQSALDTEAELRGNSVYFPGFVVPMLPEILSNGLCSLKPKVDRLCMVAQLSISKHGKLTRSKFYPAVMKSHARLTYSQVSKFLDGDKEASDSIGELAPHIANLHKLYEVLQGSRQRRGAIEFETTETRLIFGENRKIENIVPVQRNVAHRIIEECMLIANVATAKFLNKHKIPALYRVHRGPRSEKINEVREFLGPLGLNLPGGDDPEPMDYARLLQEIQQRPDKTLIQTMLLRSLTQAEYNPKNEGHFGLAYTAYAHFTSPIRRYPDLLVHRAIKQVLSGKPIKEFMYDIPAMQQLGKHCSQTERRADDATRDVVAWLKCEFMQDRVGEVFDGIISGVTGFGLFVALKDIYVEGLIHVTSLNSDYYQFDPVKQRLTGERSGVSFRLGDPIEIRVAKVDLDERRLDFEPTSIPFPRVRAKKRKK